MRIRTGRWLAVLAVSALTFAMRTKAVAGRAAGASRAHARRVRACAAFVAPLTLCVALVVPMAAVASTLPGDRIEMYKPKSLSKSAFSIKLVALTYGGNPDDVTSKTYILRGSKTKTRFTVVVKDGDSYSSKKVSYATFVRYFSQERWRPIGSATYDWKRDSHGHRYRYARNLRATLYAD